MTIKNRLALYFTLVSTVTLLVVLLGVYFTFSRLLQNDFYHRLDERALISAKVFLEADEISPAALKKVRNQYLENLNSEIVRIYNSKNEAVFIEDEQQYWTNSIIDKVKKQKKVRFREGDRQIVGIFYKDNQGDFVILVSAIDKSTSYRLIKLQQVMMVTFLLITILLLLSARWIAKRILWPLDQFITQVKHIKSNNLDFRVSVGKNKDEIELLARNFNELMAHLEQAFVLQKTFIANASHELRTPITSMLMSAEIALANKRSLNDYQQVLTSVIEDAEKMNNIITALLDLAQADIDLGGAKLEEVDLIDMIKTIKQQWQKENFTLAINNAGHDDHVMVYANATLLLIAINNLISNAFKFSDGKIVTLNIYKTDHTVKLEVIDNGIGMEEAEFTKIFNPFYTTANQKYSGNGMGLHMSKRIALLFKGNLTVASKVQQGSTFTLSLPIF